MKAWLEHLELSEYTDLFHSEGYKEGEDMVHLKELDLAQLQQIGITKKGTYACSHCYSETCSCDHAPVSRDHAPLFKDYFILAHADVVAYNAGFTPTSQI